MTEVKIVKAEKDNKPVIRGQYYRHIENNEFYVVSAPDISKYCLIDIATGKRWQDATEDISEVFDGARHEFELLPAPKRIEVII